MQSEWVAATFIQDQGIWGVKRAKGYLATDQAARQLDDEEERMAAGEWRSSIMICI